MKLAKEAFDSEVLAKGPGWTALNENEHGPLLVAAAGLFKDTVGFSELFFKYCS